MVRYRAMSERVIFRCAPVLTACIAVAGLLSAQEPVEPSDPAAPPTPEEEPAPGSPPTTPPPTPGTPPPSPPGTAPTQQGPSGPGQNQNTSPAQPQPKVEPDIPHPHPVLMEVLFNPPRGADGDANGDGRREAAGDEFVELHNPHDKSIQLRGYSITNWLTAADAEEKRGIRFLFPRFRLGAGETVVVFNGHKSMIPGPVGTARRAPRRPNDHFGGAWVFTMANESANNAFNNESDFVLIASDEGELIEAAVWGSSTFPVIEDSLRVADVARSAKGSVQRVDINQAGMWPHVDIDGSTASPGVIPEDPTESATKTAAP